MFRATPTYPITIQLIRLNWLGRPECPLHEVSYLCNPLMVKPVNKTFYSEKSRYTTVLDERLFNFQRSDAMEAE